MSGISGLDHWLTTPPEEPDYIDEADKFLEGIKDKPPKDQAEAYLWSLVEGLRGVIQEETGL